MAKKFNLQSFWDFLMISILSIVAVSATVGDCPIHKLQTHSVEGLNVSLQPTEGKSLLLLFWNPHSWRANETAATFLDIYRRFHTHGLEVVGICTDPLEEEILEFSEQWRIPWPQVMNVSEGTEPLTQRFGVSRIPFACLIDSQGKRCSLDLDSSELNVSISSFLGLNSESCKSTSVGSRNGHKRDWGPEQAVGEPNTQPGCDGSTAWASLSPDGQEEWLMLAYDEPILPTALKIYQSLNPGAITRICGIASTGTESTLWKQTDSSLESSKHNCWELPIQTQAKINRIKLILDSQNHPGFNEIDAVGLVDAQGTTVWASDAEASSSYTEEIQSDSGEKDYVLPTDRKLPGFSQLVQVESAVREMKEAASSMNNEIRNAFRYHIKAFVEGTSVLVMHRNTARWYHADTAAEGFQSDERYPTYINGAGWYPEWTEPASNRWSALYANITPAFPTTAVTVDLKNPQVQVINCAAELNNETTGQSGLIGQAPKGRIYLLQRPTAENDYILALAFEDFVQGGASLYDCYLDIRPPSAEGNASLARATATTNF